MRWYSSRIQRRRILSNRFRLIAGVLAGLGLSSALTTMTMTAPVAAAAPAAVAPADPAGCGRLAPPALPHTRITSVQSVAAGAFTAPGAAQQSAAFKQLPAFCRVAAT